MATPFERLARTWSILGEDDPLWGVLSHHGKRGGHWDAKEFLQTGEHDVERLHRILIESAAAPWQFDHVLDFGCGVGRLSLAWSRRARRVTGVDISDGMIETGRQLLGKDTHVELVLNTEPNLRRWPADSFDLVFSYICLQHMPWPLASGYLTEFARVCRENRWVAFQIPSRQLGSTLAARVRRKLVDALPFGLSRAYRKWRHGTSAAFEMFFTPPAMVEDFASAAGLRLVHREPDPGSGPGTEGFFYVFQKGQATTLSKPVASA